MDAQNGGIFGAKISNDHCGSKYCTHKDVDKILDHVGLKGKFKNMVVSLKLFIIKCFIRSCNEGNRK